MTFSTGYRRGWRGSAQDVLGKCGVVSDFVRGTTIKELVLASTLGAADPGSDEARALGELEALLDARMRRAKIDGFSTRSVGEIFDEGIAEIGQGPDG